MIHQKRIIQAKSFNASPQNLASFFSLHGVVVFLHGDGRVCILRPRTGRFRKLVQVVVIDHHPVIVCFATLFLRYAKEVRATAPKVTAISYESMTKWVGSTLLLAAQLSLGGGDELVNAKQSKQIST